MVTVKMKMKYRMQVLLGMVCVSLLLYAWSMQAGPLSQQGSNARSGIHVRTDAPLVIVGNAQLAAAASGGNGSRAAPYLLGHKVINMSGMAQDGISIRDTDKYFILGDCVITDTKDNYAGVRLSNVRYAQLENITAFNNFKAIVLVDNSKYNIITGNLLNNNRHSVTLFSSHNNSILSNTANNNIASGFYLDGSHNNTLANNFANANGFNGFLIIDSNHTRILGNTASGNQYGIEVMESHFNQILGNTLRGNDYCVVESGVCIGNTIASNDCGTEIPGFPWVLVCLGLLSALGLGLLLRRTHPKI